MNDKSLIVIVTYNSEDFIEDCLASIAEQDYKNWQLVIVDNSSSDDTVRRIRHFRNQTTTFDTENFKLIHLRKNIGFAGAVNHAAFNGTRISSGRKKENNSGGFDYLILLNPDMYLLPGALRSLTDTFKSNNGNSIGVCGGLILDYEKDIVQHLSGKVTPNFITYHDGAGISLSDIKNGKDIHEADYVTGAFFATRFSLFTSIGGFDRGYRPVYFEELDYCMKLKEAGWQIISNMRARCRHFEGASIKKFSNRFYRHYHKNRIRCAIINLDILEFIRFFIPAEIKWLLRKATKDQSLPILYAYFINKLLLLYNLGVKIKNYLILNRIELK
jgi:GT2 family glycosyltransferase